MSFNFQSSPSLPFHCKLMTSFLTSQRDNDNIRFCSPPRLGKALSVGSYPLSPVTVGRFPSLHLFSGTVTFSRCFRSILALHSPTLCVSQPLPTNTNLVVSPILREREGLQTDNPHHSLRFHIFSTLHIQSSGKRYLSFLSLQPYLIFSPPVVLSKDENLYVVALRRKG